MLNLMHLFKLTTCVFLFLSSLQSPLCVPNLLSPDNGNILGSVKIGKYTEVHIFNSNIILVLPILKWNLLLQWFHDVSDREISSTCEDALKLLCNTFGCQVAHFYLHNWRQQCMILTFFTSRIVNLSYDRSFSLRWTNPSDNRNISAV